MYAGNGVSERARWEVIWFSKGKWHRKNYEHDFAGALEFYEKVKATDRQGVTLRCTNMGFPPPDQYADDKYEIVRKRVNGSVKKFKRNLGPIIPRVYHHKMTEVNLKGFFWCPYCIKMRKFKKVDHEWNVAFECPACGVSCDHGVVRKYNPHAVKYTNMRRTRSDKGVGR